MNKFFIYFIIFISFCACKKQNNNKSFSYKNYIKDSIKINDRNTSYNPNFLKTCNIDDTSFIINISNNNRRLYFFNLKGILKDSCAIPSGLQSKIINFVFINKDSIIYLTKEKELILTGFDSIIIKKWNIDFKLPILGQNYHYASSYEYPLIYNENKIYVYHYPDFSIVNKQNQKLYYDSLFPEVIIQLKKDTSILIMPKIDFPNIFKKNCYYSFYPTRAINNKEIIYSYNPISDIFVYHTENKTVSIMDAHSNSFKKNSTFKDENFFNYNYITEYLCSNSRYNMLIYDQFSRQYYRICKHAINFINEDQTTNNWLDAPWSILILDSEFKVKKEVIFPAKKYDLNCILITKKGILISKYNYLNPQKNEIPFDLFFF